MSESPSSLERAAARNLVKNYLRVKPGENVIVDTWTHTLPMASAMVDEVRRVGGSACTVYESDDAWWRAVQRKQTKLLGRLSAPEWAALQAAEVYVMFWGPGDSARVESTAEKPLDQATAWFDRWYKVAQSTGLRGGRMDVGFVTDTRARQWGFRKNEWRNGLLEGCLVDPKEMAASGRRLSRAFTGAKKVRITHSNGTDVEVALAGVPSRFYEGYPHPKNEAYSQYDMLANFPAGKFITALDSKTAEGRIVATHPSYDLTWYPWQTYSGGTFEFSDGKLTSFTFEEGEAEFARHYAQGTPGKDRTGQLEIGLNPKIKNLPYADDKERGSVRVRLGGNEYAGGSNPSDFMGCLSLAGSEISVGGTPVVRAGKIL
ncbi:MAG: aminopeptidase [Thermoplasmata archaeon]|nr:aminopeptidase [Thermoplasmata archaeon]